MNELQHETSPYLLQHANNPVHWVAWNDKNLQKAKAENKLIIVSIGYSACHWCHVMEHESFEDKRVAEIMNASFISIKVDREERPDLDQVYLDAAYVITGQGGWPLNAICLPDGRPVYAGTYFPKQQWISVLTQLVNLWENEPEKLQKQAEQLLDHAKSFDLLEMNPNHGEQIHFKKLMSNWLQSVDWKYGGEQGSPKFPMPSSIELQMAYGYYFNDERAQEFALFSLEQIANGGIYDHIGGGFARYSVDEQWHVPHFEKMLYDNAQLLSVLSMAYQMSKNPLFQQRAQETITFLLREMRSPEKLFCSAYDADSEGEEGKFYVFNQQEIETLLGKNATLFSSYFDVSEQGNWEGKNVLRVVKNKEKFANQNELTTEEFDTIIQQCKQKLFDYREQRTKPGLDDKQITAWNALIITAFCNAYRAFGNEQWKQIALETAKALCNCILQSDGKVYRITKNGKATIAGFLDDYSFLAEAFLHLYEITFEPSWLEKAQLLIDYCVENFYDKESTLFFYTSKQDAALILRKKETSDNVIPSSNSSLLKAMVKLAKITGNTELENKVTQTVQGILPIIKKNGRNYSNWLQLALWIQEGSKEVTIVGEEAEQIRKKMQTNYLPNAFFLGGTDDESLTVLNCKHVEGKTMIYVCKNHSCQQPVEDVKDAIQLL